VGTGLGGPAARREARAAGWGGAFFRGQRRRGWPPARPPQRLADRAHLPPYTPTTRPDRRRAVPQRRARQQRDAPLGIRQPRRGPRVRRRLGAAAARRRRRRARVDGCAAGRARPRHAGRDERLAARRAGPRAGAWPGAEGARCTAAGSTLWWTAGVASLAAPARASHSTMIILPHKHTNSMPRAGTMGILGVVTQMTLRVEPEVRTIGEGRTGLAVAVACRGGWARKCRNPEPKLVARANPLPPNPTPEAPKLEQRKPSPPYPKPQNPDPQRKLQITATKEHDIDLPDRMPELLKDPSLHFVMWCGPLWPWGWGGRPGRAGDPWLGVGASCLDASTRLRHALPGGFALHLRARVDFWWGPRVPPPSAKAPPPPHIPAPTRPAPPPRRFPNSQTVIVDRMHLVPKSTPGKGRHVFFSEGGGAEGMGSEGEKGKVGGAGREGEKGKGQKRAGELGATAVGVGLACFGFWARKSRTATNNRSAAVRGALATPLSPPPLPLRKRRLPAAARPGDGPRRARKPNQPLPPRHPHRLVRCAAARGPRSAAGGRISASGGVNHRAGVLSPPRAS
jgi:hypothetical protein